MDHTVDQNGNLRASTVVTVSAIVIALIKVRIIFREFMEVRPCPGIAVPTHRCLGCAYRRVPVGQLLRGHRNLDGIIDVRRLVANFQTGEHMSSRSSDKEVLVVIGAGGMGLSIARRVGLGRVMLLADINESGLVAAAESLSPDGHQVVTQRFDLLSRKSGGNLSSLSFTAARRRSSVVRPDSALDSAKLHLLRGSLALSRNKCSLAQRWAGGAC
jgi:hypothetical protein